MTGSILEVTGISGGYSRNRPVIHDINFTVKPGEMIGLIGLNGAGKSTTMKHILGLLKPQQGTVRIAGSTLEQQPALYRSSLAYVPESPVLYEELTVREHLELSAMTYGLSREEYEERVAALLEDFHMQGKLDTFSMHLSKGMRQKLMVMSAFLVRPPLYVIDEPFLGLDPLGIRSLLELMVRMKAAGAGILMSSHILSTIEKYCDRFIVMHEGSIAAQGTLDELSIAAGMGRGSAPLEEVFYELVKGGSSTWM